MHQLWHELGFDRLHAVFRRARYTAPVEQAIRVMVFNRLWDADSKLGALRWPGLLSLDNLQMLSELKLPGDRALEFILAVPGRRHGDFVELLQPPYPAASGAHRQHCANCRHLHHPRRPD